MRKTIDKYSEQRANKMDTHRVDYTELINYWSMKHGLGWAIYFYAHSTQVDLGPILHITRKHETKGVHWKI